MAYQLSEHAHATALRAARVMFPHDALPDDAYEKVVRQLEVQAGGDDEVAASIEDGVAQLDATGEFVDRDADAQLDALKGVEGSAFFDLLKATAVVELYDNPAVWKAFGYEGPSAHRGGYVDRGFADLEWLPEPPIVLDPTVGSHHR
jgi:hypothetical protein